MSGFSHMLREADREARMSKYDISDSSVLLSIWKLKLLVIRLGLLERNKLDIISEDSARN